jgi:hypothetical protein
MPAKTKIMSILNRARASLEESYEYEEHAVYPPPPHQSYHHGYESYPTESYYEPRSSKYATEYHPPSHAHSSHAHSHVHDSYYTSRSESYGGKFLCIS